MGCLKNRSKGNAQTADSLWNETIQAGLLAIVSLESLLQQINVSC